MPQSWSQGRSQRAAFPAAPAQTRLSVSRFRPRRLAPERSLGPRSCQNAHDITHIINNYRLSTDGRADGHTATEICLISARPFPTSFSMPTLAASLRKNFNEKIQNVYERKVKKILLEVLSHRPPPNLRRKKMTHPLPSSISSAQHVSL